MISVPARRVKQFGVEFYQAGLTAKDIDRLVKFEVLGYSGGPQARAAQGQAQAKAARARVNWDMLEKRISESETAYQRPVIRRKIDELAAYYRECKDAATLPAIPGAVIITSEKRFTFTPVAGHHDLGPAADPRGARRAARARRPASAAGAARAQPERRGRRASRCRRCCSTRSTRARSSSCSSRSTPSTRVSTPRTSSA